MAASVLLIPGLWNSGPEHWQSHWERARPGCRRVVQREWETPDCAEWVETLERAVGEAAAPVVLAAHSLGCALVAHWAAASRNTARVRGALLVAPSDVEAPKYPPGTTGFLPMPLAKLPFPAVVAMSGDDEWVAPARAALFARSWGARLFEAGAKGHLNGDSRLGMWPEGWALIEALHA
ncbi:MAG TPA: alpha/beta hydrolase [Myxococcales bacterium]|nr:alpha/beta hydrolase [Myxococcales bacterium]